MGIPSEKILAVPLDRLKKGGEKILDAINRADGISLIDAAAVTGSIFMLLGAVYGYILRWGPIIWGLIGLVAGVIMGFLLDILPVRRLWRKNGINGRREHMTQVFIMVECDQNQVEMVENLMWENHALGVGRMDIGGAGK